MDFSKLTSEQQQMIIYARQGKNVLVNACIGSGKTTAIQELCNCLPKTKRILYLTYNKLLKLDAQNKIKNQNADVTNYHGFASQRLHVENITNVPLQELIHVFLKRRPFIPKYDVLIIDEYQDINEEIGALLLYVKEQCRGIQIIAVGDMNQKIYDHTTLADSGAFIRKFLDHPVEMEFTYCFRLPHDLAGMLGRVWGRAIHGVNQDYQIKYLWPEEVVDYLGTKETKEILCLGPSHGTRIRIQNELERRYPEKFNKNTLWSKLDNGQSDGATSPKEKDAIFTTYDGSKGMERPIEVLCDFTLHNWQHRSVQPMTRYQILRNIFCVAASRGKRELILVKEPERPGIDEENEPCKPFLTEMALSSHFDTRTQFNRPINMSQAFDFKYKEDIDACFSLLSREQLRPAGPPIPAKMTDGLIDLSPCIGTFMEASYFEQYNLQEQWNFVSQFVSSRDDERMHLTNKDLQRDVLSLTAEETEQIRYVTQVKMPFVSDFTTKAMYKRLSEYLPKNCNEQMDCEIDFSDKDLNGETAMMLRGRCDAMYHGIVTELKFVSALSHEHFLQLALYLVGLKKTTGILWNVRTNEMWRVRIKNRDAFMDQVAKTVSKRCIGRYYPTCSADGYQPNHPVLERLTEDSPVEEIDGLCVPSFREMKTLLSAGRNEEELAKDTGGNVTDVRRWKKRTEIFYANVPVAVLRTMTNSEGSLCAVGVVITNTADWRPIAEYRYVIAPEAETADQDVLFLPVEKDCICTSCRSEHLLFRLKQMLSEEKVQYIVSYGSSARFFLPGIDLPWLDIQNVSAYRKYNPFIPKKAKLYRNGRMKSGYGMEAMMRIVTGDKSYIRTGNPVRDCEADLCILERIHPDLGTFLEANGIQTEEK